MNPGNITSTVTNKELLRKLLPFFATGLGIYVADRFINSEKFDQFKYLVTDVGNEKDIFGDDEQSYATLHTIAPILSLPIQLRCKIWAFLNTGELRILRLVCGRFQCDVDMMVGVHVILDSRSPCYQWVKHIAVQSCLVKALEIPPDWNVFAKPNLLKRMEFSKEFSTDTAILKSIMSLFDYLEEISFFIKPITDEGDGFPEDLLKSFLTPLDDNGLDGLTIELIVESWVLKWTATFRKHIYKPNPQIVDQSFGKQLSHIFLSLPTISTQHQEFWLTILNNQRNLKSLNVNLGDVHWLTYKTLVETNAKSLRKVFLCQIGCRTTYDDGKRNEEPFDFAIFQECHHLEILGVSCESIFSTTHFNGHCLPTSIVNLEKVPHEELEGLLFAFLHLTGSDLELINSMGWGSNIKRGILLNCSVDESNLPTLNLKKPQIDTNTLGYYPLLGHSLEEPQDDPSCYHEPDIIACGNAIKMGIKTLFETSNVVEDWATPFAVLVWAAFC